MRVLLILILSMQAVSASIFDLNLWQADSKLKEEKFSDAVKDYLKIQAQDPDNSRLNYNLGIGLYRLGAYDNAAFNFEQAALKTESPLIKEKSLYNLGNSVFKKEDYETAIKAYEAALEIDPEDEDTKYNLELAKKKLEQEQQQNQDQQDKNQQNKDQQEQDQDKDKDKDEQDKDQQDKKDQNEDKQDQDKDNQDQNKDKQNQDKQKSKSEEKKGSLDKQEIKMLLQQVKEGKPKGKALGVQSKSNPDPKAKKKPW